MSDYLKLDLEGEDHGQWPDIYPELKLREFGFNNFAAQQFKQIMTHFRVSHFEMGGAGYPDSWALDTEKINLAYLYSLWFDFRVSNKHPVLSPDVHIKELNLMASPAVVSGGTVFELPLMRWKKEENTWIWTVVQSRGQIPEVSNVSTAELIRMTCNPTPVPDAAYRHDLTLPHEGVEHTISSALMIMETESRRIPFGYDSVMILSNNDPAINAARSRVACCLHQILSQTAQAVGDPQPSLICNGYRWQVENMHQAFGIGQDAIRDVILPEGENTMAHGTQMLEQLNPLPDQVVIVTSTEHLLRSALHIYQQIHPHEINIKYFQAPTPVAHQKQALNHEIKTLSKYLPEDIIRLNAHRRDQWDSWGIPDTVPLWARSCMGDFPSVYSNSLHNLLHGLLNR